MPTSAEIVLICPVVSSRLEYVLRFASAQLGISILAIQTDNRVKKGNSPGMIINYNKVSIDGAFNIYATGFLEITEICAQETGIAKLQGKTYLFPAPMGFDLIFDIFSAIFYILSRYEEYLPYKPDSYGRFEADQSLAFKQGFLEEPVIDQWLEILKSALHNKFPDLKFPERKFEFISTIDVDSPWAYLHKGFLHTSGGLLKTLIKDGTHELLLKWDVLRGKTPDPFDTYDYILEIEKQFGFRSRFFFLSGHSCRHDVNYALETQHFKWLIKNLKPGRTVGIHPSVKSNRSSAVLKSEFNKFSGIMGENPISSRQHFLMLDFPNTYRRLIALGIQEDYSMGYASCVGFRAGTCLPFRFYDLASEAETNLVIYPFVVMDVTLQQYLKLTPEQAIEEIISLINKVKAVKGTFISLWHNESLSEKGVWKGWKRVFESMVEQANNPIISQLDNSAMH
jgi:hypothetical protein